MAVAGDATGVNPYFTGASGDAKGGAEVGEVITASWFGFESPLDGKRNSFQLPRLLV
jgi:hypothetical protein